MTDLIIGLFLFLGMGIAAGVVTGILLEWFFD
jgi:hypothetical protein